jgi:hypothetical protein
VKLAFGTIAFAALFSPAISAAQVTTATGSSTDERRLTPEQVDAILAEAEKKRAATEPHVPAEIAAIEDSELLPPPQVHGEVGFSVGTGGYREVFGTGIYPLGQDGMAIISLDFVDWGQQRYPRW